MGDVRGVRHALPPEIPQAHHARVRARHPRFRPPSTALRRSPTAHRLRSQKRDGRLRLAHVENVHAVAARVVGGVRHECRRQDKIPPQGRRRAHVVPLLPRRRAREGPRESPARAVVELEAPVEAALYEAIGINGAERSNPRSVHARQIRGSAGATDDDDIVRASSSGGASGDDPVVSGAGAPRHRGDALREAAAQGHGRSGPARLDLLQDAVVVAQ